MSRVVILGAGIAGHTAAAFARKWLPARDPVTVESPNAEDNNGGFGEVDADEAPGLPGQERRKTAVRVGRVT